MAEFWKDWFGSDWCCPNKGRNQWLMMAFKKGSPGLVVMGGDSRSEGCGFESRHRILDGHFPHIFVVKNCNDVSLKRPKINDKSCRGWPIINKKKGTLSNTAFQVFLLKKPLLDIIPCPSCSIVAVAIICWNKVPWLAISSHVTSVIQL